MDKGGSFGNKTVSREPIERIQKIQREMQANLKKTGLIHLVGRNDRVMSQLIPGAMLVVATPLIGYGLYVIATQNAPNS